MNYEYVDLYTLDICSHVFLQKKHSVYKRGEFNESELSDINAAKLYEPQIAGKVKTGKAVLVNGRYEREYRDYTQEELDWQAKTASEEQKLFGVEFEGVRCSATAQDMWGLASIKDWVRAGNSTNFHFDNGTVLNLGPDNMDAFEAVWIPFRQSFFE